MATYLTGQTRKSMRKESVLPKVIWPIRDNSGWPGHTLLPSLLSLLQKNAWSSKLSQDTWKMSVSLPDIHAVLENNHKELFSTQDLGL